jgi:hypothetical protein
MSPACELAEMLTPIPVKGDTAAETPPRDAHVVQGLGSSPFCHGLLADLEQHSAAALVLGAHDMHAL